VLLSPTTVSYHRFLNYDAGRAALFLESHPNNKLLSIMATTSKPTSRKRRNSGGQTSRDSASKLTTNHDKIRNWVEERGGQPSTVKDTDHGVGILRIDFPGYSGEDSLEHISWDDFFQKFEENDLAFLYQEQTSDGKQSRFNKFVSREKEAQMGEPDKSEMD
jgi:hypothetical protein